MADAPLDAVLFDYAGVMTEPVGPGRLRPTDPDERAVSLDDQEPNVDGARAVGMSGIVVGDDSDAAIATVRALLGAAGADR